LRGLRDAAPRSSPDAIRLLVEQELGRPIVELFAEWDEDPFASASIGQVHRARLTDGREVAVKVQHPGIDRAVEADLENGRMIQRIVSSLGPRTLNAAESYAEIALRFREELDYALEAERQLHVAHVHAGDPHIRIPGVVRERTSRRVLTTELVRGAALDQVVGEPEARRRHYAQVLWRFVFKSNLIGAMFNADPHPGNYVLHGDGTISFLDFGCVQPIPIHQSMAALRMHLAACRRDEPGFAAGVKDLLGTRGGEYERAMLEYVRECFEPLFGSPFRVTRGYTVAVVQGIQRMKRFMISRDPSFVPPPPSTLLMNRVQFGFYSILARLDVEADYAAVERQFLLDAGQG
jgi:predicted unusual protein kinase regulating ubiquinone biosynthesis (AarF/ABC1/UbiB family)